MSRKRRALRAGLAEAWASFAERSHPESPSLACPSINSGQSPVEGTSTGDGDVSGSVSMETGEGTDAT